jgi:hypothetical protein
MCIGSDRRRLYHSTVTPTVQTLPHRPATHRAADAAASTSNWLIHGFAGLGILLVVWLAFGSVFNQLGHHSDSWAYMRVIERSGPYSILLNQPSRLALPWVWAIGHLIAGAHPWIYHLFASVFLLGAALCFYAILTIYLPGHPSFAFAIVVLATLWPADPTRYDIATLGNRQAVFLMMAASLMYVLAWRGFRVRTWLVGYVVVMTLSLLTYEGHLFLVGILPLLALVEEGRPTTRWRTFLVVSAIPPVIFAAVNLITTFTGRGELYREALLVSGPTQFIHQMIAGLTVLSLQSWGLPAQLLSAGAAPDVRTVAASTLVFLAWMLLFIRLEQPRCDAATTRRLVVLLASGLLWAPLSLAVFALSTIPMSQPDRTQTYSLIGAAIVLCTTAWLLVQKVPGRRVLFAGLCSVFVFLSMTMVTIYQRNFVQSWTEQSALLSDVVTQQPGLETYTLVLIANLPDTRLVFLSGYSCDFSLRYLFDVPYRGPNSPFPDDESARMSRVFRDDQVYCGLIYRGRDLDPWTDVEFTPDGVLLRRIGLWDHLFPYSRVLIFEYSDGSGTRLLDEIPVRLLPPGARAADYHPRALGQPYPVRPEAHEVLGR